QYHEAGALGAGVGQIGRSGQYTFFFEQFLNRVAISAALSVAVLDLTITGYALGGAGYQRVVGDVWVVRIGCNKVDTVFSSFTASVMDGNDRVCWQYVWPVGVAELPV